MRKQFYFMIIITFMGMMTLSAQKVQAVKFSGVDLEGKSISLDDFKGKYVYVDVWATWCGPCKREIPYLKDLHDEYKDKNIAFVSVSVDDNAKAWERMVTKKNLQGYQIRDAQKGILRGYGIYGIPHFILIGPNGELLMHNAPRPSSGNGIRRVFSKVGV